MCACVCYVHVVIDSGHLKLSVREESSGLAITSKCVCMYVCICVCMHVCVVCLCVCRIHVCECVYMCSYMYSVPVCCMEYYVTSKFLPLRAHNIFSCYCQCLFCPHLFTIVLFTKLFKYLRPLFCKL